MHNLYPSFRPRCRTFKLVTPSAISSTAAPHGESFGFWFSPRATRLAIASSSRLYIVDVRGAVPEIVREVLIQGRPRSVAISDDDHKLAFLSPEGKLGIHELKDGRYRCVRSCMLEEPARSIAICPDATVVAAAEKRAITILPATVDVPLSSTRRLVTEDVEHICFSENGATIIGTSFSSSSACTTWVNVSESMSDLDQEGSESRKMVHLWTSQPLFPQSFGNTTHAAPLQGDASTLIAYDAPARLFGLLEAQEAQFKHPIISAPQGVASFMATVPSVDHRRELVAIGFNGSGVRLANIPPELDAASADSCKTSLVSTTDKFSSLRWVSTGSTSREDHLSRRLVAVRSTHGNRMDVTDLPVNPEDSGHLVFYDFGFHTSISQAGDEILVELPQSSDDALDQDTVDPTDGAVPVDSPLMSRDSRRRSNAPIARSVTSATRRGARPASALNDLAFGLNDSDPLVPEEIHLDDPFTIGQPRSRASLQRSATAVANRRRRPLSATLGEFMFRRANGRDEVPDESDADNWVPPPPKYETQADSELPDFLKKTLLPRSNNVFGRLTNSSPSLPLVQPETSDSRPVPRKRKSSQQLQASYQNARTSIMNGVHGIRRAFSGPIDTQNIASSSTEAFPNLDTRKTVEDGQATAGATEEITPTPTPRTRPMMEQGRPVSMALGDESPTKRRYSVLRRPLSIHAPAVFSRSVSQPEPTVTPPKTAYPPPDSPSLPSAAQVESLHRRQASGSISSLRSEGSNNVPRGAAMAHRRTLGATSPWASSIMLGVVSETDPIPTDHSRANGKATAPEENAASNKDNQEGFQQSSAEDADIPKPRPRTQNRMSRHLKALSTIDSIQSAISSVRPNKAPSQSPARNGDVDGADTPAEPKPKGASNLRVRRSQSQGMKRSASGLQRGPSMRAKKSAAANTERARKQGLLKRVKKALWQNLNKV